MFFNLSPSWSDQLLAASVAAFHTFRHFQRAECDRQSIFLRLILLMSFHQRRILL